MDKAKLTKVAIGILITSGVAITLPAFAPLLAPAVLYLTEGVLDENTVKKLGEKGINYFVGIVGGIVANVLQESPNLFKKSAENHDLLKLFANAYSKAIDELLVEIKNNPEYASKYSIQAKRSLPEIKARLDKALKQQTPDALEQLFPSKEYLEAQKNLETESEKVSFLQRFFCQTSKEKVQIDEKFAAKQTSEEFILSISENPEISKEILVDEVEISLRRWFAETTPLIDEFPKSLTPFVFEKIAEKVPNHIGTLIKEEGFEKSWTAFQRSHLQAILKEIKDNKALSNEDKELLKPLANKLHELINSDFPNKLADSTSTIISKLSESEENIKNCIKDEKAKLQNYLLEMENRLRGDIGEAKDEIIERIAKISYEKTLPNSIPQSVGFVGREDYLEKIRKQYQNGTRTFVFHGIGGVGKSALALAFASEIKDKYQAKIFVDMKGLTNPLSARNAMLEIIREFERETPDNISDSKLTNDFTSKVQNQPTLIVLDNAKDENSVKSLINTDNTCFIITSRQRFYLGEEIFGILKMSEPDAIKLLSDKGGKERFGESVNEFARECGYLPQALIIIKGLLMKKRLLKVENFLKQFKEEKREFLDEVMASLNLSYKIIGEELQIYWRRLAVFPGDFNANACALVWEVDDATAQRILEELDSYSLIEVNLETLRYNLHDLAREFCDSKLSENERFETQNLHAIFYYFLLQSMELMEKLSPQNGFVNTVNLINLEWVNIKTGQKWTARFTDKDDNIAQLCRSYAGTISGTFGKVLYPREVINWQKDALKAIKKLNDVISEGIAYGNIGMASFHIKDFSQAIEWLEMATEHYEKFLKNAPPGIFKTDKTQMKGKWLLYLGISYIEENKKKAACSSLEKALDIVDNAEWTNINDVRQWIEENCCA